MNTKDPFNETCFEKEAPVGLYRLSPEGLILIVNQTLATMLGYETPEELVGECFDQKIIYSPSIRANFKQLLLWNEQVKDFISLWRRRDGSGVLVRETGWAIPNGEGGILFYEGSINLVKESPG